MLLKEVKNLCNTLTNQQWKCVQLLCFVGVYYWYLTYVLPLEAMQGTVTTTSVDESKHSCLPGEANSMCSSSTQPAGLGTVCSKVMITPVPAATGSSTRCGSPPEAQGCALLIYYKSAVLSETAIKALVTAESQVTI